MKILQRNYIHFKALNMKSFLDKKINFPKETLKAKTNKLIIILIFSLFMIVYEFCDVKIYKINYIHVSYSFDNNYYYITHVSMKSVMLNQNNTTFIIFHILVSKDIYKEQKIVIDKICQEHKNCKIIYHIMNNEFKEFNTLGYNITKTTATFYRILLPKLIPNEKKILYFDSDTLIYRDLNEIYNYNIDDNYFVGQYEGKPIEKYGKDLRDFICGGVLLINLDNLRKNKIFEKMIDFLNKNNRTLYYLDQDAINVVCNKKNGFFPEHYISLGYCDLNLFEYVIKSKKDFIYKYQDNNPYIIHFKVFTKPWYGIPINNNLTCFDQIGRFYEFARKTKYYFEILNVFKVLS